MKARDTQADLRKLAQAFIDNLQIDDCEYGGIGLDSKRPFGNSDVEGDILHIIGAELEEDDDGDPAWSDDQRDYARSLYHEKLIDYLRGAFTRGL